MNVEAFRFISRESPTAEVYGVSLNPERLHLPDGYHVAAGAWVAEQVDSLIRAANPGASVTGELLCNGCTMLTLYNASVALAQSNKQDLRELARTMEAVYGDLARFLEANPDAAPDAVLLKHLRIVQ